MKKSVKSLLEISEETELEFLELLKIFFAITEFEFHIYEFLIEKDKLVCIEMLINFFFPSYISKKDSKKRLIQRALSNLLKVGLITREKKTLEEFKDICKDSGIKYDKSKNAYGYLYLYKNISKQSLKLKFQSIIDTGTERINFSIANL